MSQRERSTFATILRQERTRRMWSQEDVAEKLGIESANTISRWERSLNTPTNPYTIRKLCHLFGMTPEAFGLLRKEPATTSALSLFLTYAAADEVAANRLKSDLQSQGFSIWDDVERTLNALERNSVLSQVFRTASAIVFIASPHARTTRVMKEELELADIYHRPVFSFWIAGKRPQEALPANQSIIRPIDLIDARDTLYEGALERLVLKLHALPAGSALAEAEPAFEPRNPYKGLRAFQAEDAHDFFGRSCCIDDLTQHIETLLREEEGEEPARLLAIIGPSGSGKSSLVMAGLLPQLQSDEGAVSAHWVYLHALAPGKHPLESLAAVIGHQFKERSLMSILEDLEGEHTRGLHLLATLLATEPETKVVLVVDQFEELFTQTASEEERKQFIDVLVTAATELGGPVVIILTLRADYYDRPMSYPELAKLIERRPTLVLPMSVQELREAIERPAFLPDVRLTFDEHLVGDLLFEMHGQSGILPLLEFTLDQLFAQRRGSQLTQQAYREIGGVRGALSRHAESTYAGLPSEEHRRLARGLFLRLIDAGVTEQETTRHRAALIEFALDDSSTSRRLHETIEAFIGARLLTTSAQASVPSVEVSHEMLIREWGRLANWLHEAREDIRLQQSLSEDAAAWQRKKKQRDRLYRGSQLQEAQAWARRNTASGSESAFLRASAGYSLWLLARVICLVVLLIATSGFAVWAMARLFSTATTVTTLDDSGAGSLREVLSTAKPGSTVTFDSALDDGTINLTQGDLNIVQSLSIRGPGAGKLVISSGMTGHVIRVARGAIVTISGLTFAGSEIRGPFSFINNEGNLTLKNSTIAGNSTRGAGGGINNVGDLTISNSIIAGNSTFNASGDGGGGIFNQGLLTMTDSQVVNNQAPNAGGGGIENQDHGTLILDHSTIASNSSTESGGGISNRNWLTIGDGSSISGNVTLTSGGGIDSEGLLTITGSVIAGNTATMQGGGINNRQTLIIQDSLISGNRAAMSGGGIANEGILTMSASKIVHNTTMGSGGGITEQENLLDQTMPSTLTGCTMFGNTAHSGGGIFIQKGVSIVEDIHQSVILKILKSMVTGNSAAIGPNVAGALSLLVTSQST